jgi:hypothetical protein
MKWQMLDIPDPAEQEKYLLVVRLNSLGSLYFFEKYTLHRTRLSENFHKPILDRLEEDHLRYLLEAPRDHYKTVMVTEGRTIWRSLPFDNRDEASMRELGYDDAWITRMKRIHRADRRTLIVSEVLSNAIKLGVRFDWHYQENMLFRACFPEIVPTAKETWTNESKQQKCAGRGPQGEGTYDFIGVGGALQSRHYSDIVEDDVIGKEALESELVMEKTIDYHKLLIGAFESFSDGTWTVVNNRWAPNDLSGWIRKNQPEFVIESHGAFGGCDPAGCHDDHVNGVPIFPEEFSVEVLEEIRKIQGPYIFSHQYLNLPVAPEECIFKPEWLRYYEPTVAPNMPIEVAGADVFVDEPTNAHGIETKRFSESRFKNKPELGGRYVKPSLTKHWLKHELKDGEKYIKPMNPNQLIRTMIVDPNHAGTHGRARHAIVVTGLDPETERIYLLDVWAESNSYDALMTNVYKMATMWGMTEFWLETVAAQKYLKYHIEYRNKVEKRSLKVLALKSDTGANAKRTRIEALEPLLRNGKLWVRHDQSVFINEYMDYPGGLTVDILDCLGYGTQTWNAHYAKQISKLVEQHRNRWKARKSNTGY